VIVEVQITEKEVNILTVYTKSVCENSLDGELERLLKKSE
jgi:hypothetical protein